MMEWKYLHSTGTAVTAHVLDHRLTPEVSAMFAAMASRNPPGGIAARYREVVEAIGEDLYNEARAEREDDRTKWDDWKTVKDDPRYAHWLQLAEECLTTYPIHSRVQEFFDKFVGKYGHSSILELTGKLAVAVEGISWFTAYQLFDSPLVTGQELSTRAVRRADWPMCREAFVVQPNGSVEPHKELRALHHAWLTVFEKEVAAWKIYFSKAENREKHGIADKEPFRPALDRARWAIPGTIATGCVNTSHLRERARVLRDGRTLAGDDPILNSVWEDIENSYKRAAPGLAGLGLREAIYSDEAKLPGHLRIGEAEEFRDVSLTVGQPSDSAVVHSPYIRMAQNSYVDPYFNRIPVNIRIRCSLAVSRDWHRHRTFYPWQWRLVLKDGKAVIDHHYEPLSDLGKSQVDNLVEWSTRVYQEFRHNGDQNRAMLALPFGARVEMHGQAGLRDFVYTMELRGRTHGANFEYKEQALQALNLLESRYGTMHVAGGTLAGYLGWASGR